MIIVDQNGYQYFAIGLGTFCLTPQLYKGITTGSLRDVSILSITCISISSLLWGYYMYEKKLLSYMYAACFVFLNSLCIICLQLCNWFNDFRSRHTYNNDDKV